MGHLSGTSQPCQYPKTYIRRRLQQVAEYMLNDSYTILLSVIKEDWTTETPRVS